MKSMKVFLVLLLVLSLLMTSAFAKEKKEKTSDVEGTWSRGEEVNDPKAPFSGIIIDAEGNETIMDESEFSVITEDELNKLNNQKPEEVTTNDWTDSSTGFRYIYTTGSYQTTSSKYDRYHYLVGLGDIYNSGTTTINFTFAQAASVTNSWSVTNQLSATTDLKQNYFSKLSLSYGFSYTSSNTTSSSTQIIASVPVPPGKSGQIKAYLPGAYAMGYAYYKQYKWDPKSGFYGNWVWTGNTVRLYEGGWSPLANKSVSALYCKSYIY